MSGWGTDGTVTGGGSSVPDWIDLTGWETADVTGLDLGSGESVSEVGGVTSLVVPQGVARTFWDNGFTLDTSTTDQDPIAVWAALDRPQDYEFQFEAVIVNGWDKIDGNPYLALNVDASSLNAIVATQLSAGVGTSWDVDSITAGSVFPSAGETLTADTFRLTIRLGDSSNHATGGNNESTVNMEAFSSGVRVWRATEAENAFDLADVATLALETKFKNFSTHSNGDSQIDVRFRYRIVPLA